MSVISDLVARAIAVKGEIDDLITESRGSVEGLEATIEGLNGQLAKIQEQTTNVAGLLETITTSKETVATILGESAAALLGQAEEHAEALHQQLDGIRQLTEDAIAGVENLISEITVLTDSDTGAGSTAKDVAKLLKSASE